jgi:hypothetical protein
MLKLHHAKQACFTALLLILIAVLEIKAAIGAYDTVVHVAPFVPGTAIPLAAAQHAALSLVSALLAFFTFGFAGRLKDDERPHVARRAFAARIVSLVFLLIPIGYLGSSLKADRLAAEWETYRASAAYTADVATVADPLADLYLRREAQVRLVEPATPALSIADFEWWLALVFQGVLILASDALRVPAPITDEERRHWRAVRAGHKAAATRKRRAAAKKKPAFRVFAGGKS